MAWRGITYETAHKFANELLDTGMFDVDPEQARRALAAAVAVRMEAVDSLGRHLVREAIDDAVHRHMPRGGTGNSSVELGRVEPRR